MLCSLVSYNNVGFSYSKAIKHSHNLFDAKKVSFIISLKVEYFKHISYIKIHIEICNILYVYVIHMMSNIMSLKKRLVVAGERGAG